MNYETCVDKTKIYASDTFNLARGLNLYVVACLCERAGLPMPERGARLARVGFCDADGAPALAGDATHFGWTFEQAGAPSKGGE